jgi:hypothetical protein
MDWYYQSFTGFCRKFIYSFEDFATDMRFIALLVFAVAVVRLAWYVFPLWIIDRISNLRQVRQRVIRELEFCTSVRWDPFHRSYGLITLNGDGDYRYAVVSPRVTNSKRQRDIQVWTLDHRIVSLFYRTYNDVYILRDLIDLREKAYAGIKMPAMPVISVKVLLSRSPPSTIDRYDEFILAPNAYDEARGIWVYIDFCLSTGVVKLSRGQLSKDHKVSLGDISLDTLLGSIVELR